MESFKENTFGGRGGGGFRGKGGRGEVRGRGGFRGRGDGFRGRGMSRGGRGDGFRGRGMSRGGGFRGGRGDGFRGGRGDGFRGGRGDGFRGGRGGGFRGGRGDGFRGSRGGGFRGSRGGGFRGGRGGGFGSERSTPLSTLKRDGTEYLIKFPTAGVNAKSALTEICNMANVIYMPRELRIQFPESEDFKKNLSIIKNFELDNNEKLKVISLKCQIDPLRKCVYIKPSESGQSIDLEELKIACGAENADYTKTSKRVVVLTYASAKAACEAMEKKITFNDQIIQMESFRQREESTQPNAKKQKLESEKENVEEDDDTKLEIKDDDDDDDEDDDDEDVEDDDDEDVEDDDDEDDDDEDNDDDDEDVEMEEDEDSDDE